jgi:hypothetical protein
MEIKIGRLIDELLDSNPDAAEKLIKIVEEVDEHGDNRAQQLANRGILPENAKKMANHFNVKPKDGSETYHQFDLDTIAVTYITLLMNGSSVATATFLAPRASNFEKTFNMNSYAPK